VTLERQGFRQVPLFAWTDTETAPWTVVKSNDEKRARIIAMRHVLSKFDYDNKGRALTTRPARVARVRTRRTRVRLVATVLLWLVTTVLLAVAVPTMWAERNIVDGNGYSAFAASAAKDPQLQQAMAGLLATEVSKILSEYGQVSNSELISGVASAYTTNPSFPGQFALANAVGHRWMFADAQQVETGEWVVDLSPMLADESFRKTLATFDVETPDTVPVPLDVSDNWRPGQLKAVSTWGPWVSIGSTIMTGVFALLTLAAVPSRGKALAALGVSGLVVGAAGWAGLEVARRYIDDALNRMTGDIRQVADVMVHHAEDSLHHWLNLTLAGGGVLVVFGVLASMLGGLRRREV
jgi:Polyphosphate kinase 2 (PPK2)